MTPKEILESILKNEEINYAQLAKAMGLSRVQPLYDIRDGKVKRISENYASKIMASYPQYSRIWLLTGEGEMLNKPEDNNAIPISISDIKEDDYRGTLVYDIDATCGTDCRDIDFTVDHVIGSINLPGINKNSKIVRANGDSMEPKIYDGNLVVVREILSWSDIFYGQAYLILLDEYRMIKYIRRYEPDEENYIILRSENAKYDDIKLHRSKIRKLFIVENILSIKNQL